MNPDAVATLVDFLAADSAPSREAGPLLVLTGAGISTSSGIPTYRDEAGTWLRSAPITHQEFTADARQRQRYWGRSTLGWPAISDARPTAAHRGLAALQTRGTVGTIVTQNVDRLHQRAGSDTVVDLHGRLDRVLCLACGDAQDRSAVQGQLLALNPWLARPVSAARPDGDADLAEDEIDDVRVPDCQRCGGTLMPDVVFFGGSIPRERIETSRAALSAAAGLLVIGSSLQVYSGYRFCRWARAEGIPILIANPGRTRADELADARVTLTADDTVAALADAAALLDGTDTAQEMSA